MRNTKLQPAFTRFLAVHKLATPINMQRFCDWLEANGTHLTNLNASYLAHCNSTGAEFDPMWVKDLFEREVGIITHWRDIPTLREPRQ